MNTQTKAEVIEYLVEERGFTIAEAVQHVEIEEILAAMRPSDYEKMQRARGYEFLPYRTRVNALRRRLRGKVF